VYLYNGANLIEEADAAGNLVARYVFGAGIDESLAASRGSTWEFYQADGLGSITSLSTTTGTVSDSFVYDSFGNVTSSTGTFAQPFRYTGREWDAETGQIFYRARYYDPSAGRFLNEDPIGFTGGINFYRYVSNRPNYFRDPSGLLSIGPGFTPQCLADLLSAIQILKERIKTVPACNCWFASHGTHMPLGVMLDNPLFTIKYDPKGNSEMGEANTLAYVNPKNALDVFLVPLGCGSGPVHIAQDIAMNLPISL
jgi:RHS repeat-associated protein